jgi:hypothetical protein
MGYDSSGFGATGRTIQGSMGSDSIDFAKRPTKRGYWAASDLNVESPSRQIARLKRAPGAVIINPMSTARKLRSIESDPIGE